MTSVSRSMLRRTSNGAIVVLAIAIAACGPMGGDGSKDSRPCISAGNAEWQNEGTVIDMTLPATCPYTVRSVGAALDFHFNIDFIRSRIPLYTGDGFEVDLNVFDANRARIQQQAGSADENAPYVIASGEQPLRAELGGSYPGGRGTKPRDSADVRYAASPGINGADGWAIIPGDVSPNTSSMSGASRVNYNSANTWRAATQWDANSYTYQWRVNGQDVSGATGSTFTTSFPDFGTYTVSGIVRRTDNTADTVNMSVTSNFVASISGPGVLDPNAGAGTWTASAPGGYAPFSYQWTLDGRVVGSSSSYSSFIGSPSSTHDLGLRVTDGHGHVATAAQSIFISAGGTCLREPCP